MSHAHTDCPVTCRLAEVHGAEDCMNIKSCPVCSAKPYPTGAAG